MNTFDNTLCTHCVAADTRYGGFTVYGYGTDCDDAHDEASEYCDDSEALTFFHATEAAYQYARMAGGDAQYDRFKIENNCLFLAESEQDVEDEVETSYSSPERVSVPPTVNSILALGAFLERHDWIASVYPARPTFHGEPNGYTGRGACRINVRDPRDRTRTLFDRSFETVRAAARFIESVWSHHEALAEGVAA